MSYRIAVVAACAWILAGCAGAAPPQAAASPSEAVSASPTPSASPSASPSAFTAPADAPTPVPIPSSEVTPEPEPSAAATPLPGTTPFPTPGPTITPGSTRVIGTIHLADGSPAKGVCVILEKGICPIATDDQGVWFTDIPAGPINWNFIYKDDAGQEAGRQFVLGTSGGELRLPIFTLTR